MTNKEHELEVKFFVTQLSALENRVRALGATRVSVRTYEVNLRFDTPARELTSGHRVLRLRQDANALMTYKGPSQARDDVTARLEIEFEVGDFQAARRLLEALGYQVESSYEKYRTTYEMEGVKITLDELPYGKFCEVEGPDAGSIQSVAGQLGLDWSARVMDSYLVMFGRLKEKMGWDSAT
jgi:adenylate cyclase class 2